jgi:alkylated DNA repair dioxygenase AlkB
MSHYLHKPNFLFEQEAQYLLDYLENQIPWRQVKYYKPERGYVITPRLTWVAGSHDDSFAPLGHLKRNPIPSPLLPLKNLIEDELDTDFNFILFSKYRDGQDSITFHSDDERFLGFKPTIASITDYMHAVPKTSLQKAPRYSMTFRKALNEFGTKNYYTYN